MSFLLLKIFTRIVSSQCLNCASLFPISFGMCRNCYRQVKHKYTRDYGDHEIISLLRWGTDEPSITSLAYFLKGRLSYALWCEIADELYKCVGPGWGDNSQRVVFIPIPSTSGNYHSYYFAKAAAQVFSRPEISALYTTMKVEQKNKSRVERQNIQFFVREEFTDLLAEVDRIILLDDVITTGATYKAAINTLRAHVKPHTEIALWTALSRDKLYRC